MFYTLLKIQRFFEGLYQTGISLLRILLRFSYKNKLKAHRVSGKELVILGNGPSMKNELENLDFLSKEADYMAVNQFVLTDQFVSIKPGNYVLMDIGYFSETTIPRVKEITDQLIIAFKGKTTWPLKLFIPKEGKGSRLHRELSLECSWIQFVFFNRTNVEGLAGFRHWAYSANLGMPKPQNVLIGCLMIGVCLTYSKIILLGADHSWLENIKVDENNALISVEKHFYDKDSAGKPTKKEHPETLQSLRLHDYLNDLARTFSAYHDIRKFADHRRIQIVNATPGSYIDAFERLK